MLESKLSLHLHVRHIRVSVRALKRLRCFRSKTFNFSSLHSLISTLYVLILTESINKKLEKQLNRFIYWLNLMKTSVSLVDSNKQENMHREFAKFILQSI
jgi:hypothetical protein